MLIAIDGPTASGKSTVARTLAEHFGWSYISTGMLYRALGYVLTTEFGYDQTRLATPTIADVQASIANLQYDLSTGQVGYKNQDITAYLKTKDADKWASIVAANKTVRTELLPFIRALVQGNDVVMEGRDIGSVVLPHADIKFFVTATVQERARRWQQYQAARGKEYSIDEAGQAIQDRDHRDQTREHSPMVISEQAHIVDTTHLNKEETLQRMVEIINTHMQRL